MNILEFRVYGIAQPKGSHRAFTPRGMKFPIVTDSNRSAASWSQLIAAAASEHLNDLRGTADDVQLTDGAIRVVLTFALPRPKAIKGKPLPHLKNPDLDKLTRCALDALTGVIYQDDAQVIDVHAFKRYAEPLEAPHCTIKVEAIHVGDLFSERGFTCSKPLSSYGS